MSEFIETVRFSLSVTGPIFIMLMLGVWLRRVGIINEAFIESGSKLVFTVTLPSLLFLSISQSDFSQTANIGLVLYALIASVIVFILLEIVAAYWVDEPSDRGVFVQGGYRSNMGIVGLAYCINAYGDEGLKAASLYLGMVTILFNVLAVITLNRANNRENAWGKTLRGVVTNPLIIGILLGVPVSLLGLKLPDFVVHTGEYFARMTLPLALLCTGGALSLKSMNDHRVLTFGSSIAKLIAVPLLITGVAIILGFRGIELGILLLMTSAPTAAASYVMVRTIGGNATVAANIIAVTTLGSILTTTLGVMWLRHLQWM